MQPTYLTVRSKKTGKIVAAGAQQEVADALGVTQPTVSNWVRHGCKRYEITVEPDAITPEDAAAWERFCAPIRKKYGIQPRKRA